MTPLVNEFKINEVESIGFCSASETIRQFPQNYMLARKVNGIWVADCDGAVSTKTALYIAMSIHCGGRFGSGANLALEIMSNFNLFSIEIDDKK
jgi:hypothetical protein